jgi:DNA helicase-4
MKASPAVKENPTTSVPAENVTAKALPKKVLHAGRDLNQTVGLTLACLSHMSESKYYGVTTLVDILRGSRSKRLLSAKLDQIPEYGVLRGMKREDLSALVEWLIENHYILQTKGPYPVLHPTYDGMHYAETITVRKLEKLKEYLESERTEE